MQRTIRERVEASFAQDEDKVLQYIEWLRTSMAELSQNVRRMALTLLLLIAAFEFLLNSPNVVITLGIVKITASPIVLQLIPAVVSYLFLQMWQDSMRMNLLRRAFRASFASWSPRGGMNDLDMLIMPRFYLFWFPGAGVRAREVNTVLFDKVERLVAIAFLVVTMFGVIFFQVQAYTTLYHRAPNGPGPLWVISLIVTLFCFAIVFVPPQFRRRSR